REQAAISAARKRFQENWNKAFTEDEANELASPPPPDVASGGVPKKHREISFDLADGTHMQFPNQRALAEWLAIQQRVRKSNSPPEDITMEDFTTKLRTIAKREGVHVICKIMVADSRSYGITQDELVALISDHERQDGESAAKCFSRHYEADTADGLALRKAIEITKNA